MSSGSLAGPGSSSGNKPWLSCTGYVVKKAGWGSQVIKTNPTTYEEEAVTIDDQPLFVSDLYTGDPPTSSVPYFWWEKSFCGTFRLDTADDVCAVTPAGDQPLGFAQPGQYEAKLLIRSSTFDLTEVEPTVLMCPFVFSAELTALYQVTWSDPASQVQLSTAMPAGSITLFHEFTHLTTFWSRSGDGTTNGRQSKIIDITCQ